MGPMSGKMTSALAVRTLELAALLAAALLAVPGLQLKKLANLDGSIS